MTRPRVRLFFVACRIAESAVVVGAIKNHAESALFAIGVVDELIV
jgi:hypothetical protein